MRNSPLLLAGLLAAIFTTWFVNSSNLASEDKANRTEQNRTEQNRTEQNRTETPYIVLM